MVSAAVLVIGAVLALVMFFAAERTVSRTASGNGGNRTVSERETEERDRDALSDISIPDGPDFGAREMVSEAKDTLSGSVKKSFSELGDSLSGAGKRGKEILDKVKSTVNLDNDILDKLSGITESLDEGWDKISDLRAELEDHREKLKEKRQKKDSIVQRYRDLSSEYREAVRDHNEEKEQRIESQLYELREEAKRTREDIKGLVQKIRDLIRKLKGLLSSIKDLFSREEEVEEEEKEAEEEEKGLVRVYEEVAERNELQTAEAAENMGDFVDSEQEEIKELEGATEEIEDETEQQREDVEQMKEVAEDEIAEGRSAAETLGDIIEDIDELVEEGEQKDEEVELELEQVQRELEESRQEVLKFAGTLIAQMRSSLRNPGESYIIPDGSDEKSEEREKAVEDILKYYEELDSKVRKSEDLVAALNSGEISLSEFMEKMGVLLDAELTYAEDYVETWGEKDVEGYGREKYEEEFDGSSMFSKTLFRKTARESDLFEAMERYHEALKDLKKAVESYES